MEWAKRVPFVDGEIEIRELVASLRRLPPERAMR